MTGIELGRNIARLRKKAGVSQRVLAQALGITVQAVSKWERSLSCPDVMMLPDISRYFGISIDDLFFEKMPDKTVFEKNSTFRI